MASRTEDVEKRITALSDLMADAKAALSRLAGAPDSELRQANLQATIAAAQREIALARRSLQGAHNFDAAAEALSRLQEARLAARSDPAAQRAKDQSTASDAIKTILTSVSTKVNNQGPRPKKDPNR